MLCLPAELRNLIYYHVLGGKTWRIREGRAAPDLNGTSRHSLALLEVNRQIHSEALLIPYIHNTFEGRHDGHLREWVDSLPDRYRKAITSVKRHQRSYIVQGAQGLEVSPVFWMAIPDMDKWGLDGLKRLEIEIVLFTWRWDLNQREVDVAKKKALEKLREVIEDQHQGVQLVIT